MLEFISQHIT